MSVIFIPCLNVDNPNEDTGLSVGVAAGQGGGESGTLSPGIEISHAESPVTLIIIPVPPYISLGINFRWWADLFGLGETRIEREKETIQDVYTPIFKYLKRGYGFPLRDDHALQFESDYVERMFRDDPFKKLSAPGMYQAALPLAQSVFVDNTPSRGQRERIVNQFLANAHINHWPESAWIPAWNGLLDAAQAGCRRDKGRWMKNPMLVETMSKYAVLLQYMPLQNFVSAVSEHKVGDPDGRKVLRHWIQNPQLVAGIQTRQPVPDWAVAYKSPQDGGGQSGNPYETQQIAERAPIQQLWQGVTYQRPWYPDLIYLSDEGLAAPTRQIEQTPRPDDWNDQNPNTPWPGDNVVEIPPQPQGPQEWPQYPDCPPWNSQGQTPDPDPDPQPDPDDPGQQDGKCDPDCQWQIDYLLDRVEFLDNWLNYGIIPRLDNLEDWTRDLEHRVPGPMPPLPNPVPFPPWLPPEEIPTDPGDIDGELPGEDGACDFTEADCEELNKWIDPELRCKEIQKCERELECVEVPFCDEAGGPWGGMAECWLSKNTNNPPDVTGDRAGRQYPEFSVQAMLLAFSQGYQGQGQGGQGQGSSRLTVSEQSPEGEAWRIVSPYKQLLLDSWDGAEWVTMADPTPLLEERTWIYADPESEAENKIKIRQPRLRPDEIDPCAVVVDGDPENPVVEQ